MGAIEPGALMEGGSWVCNTYGCPGGREIVLFTDEMIERAAEIIYVSEWGEAALRAEREDSAAVGEKMFEGSPYLETAERVLRAALEVNDD
jgi:hypothetical protein